MLNPMENATQPTNLVETRDGALVDSRARIRFSYGCAVGLLDDGDIYNVAHPEGFCQDKSGEYWPNGELDKPAIAYGHEVVVKHFCPKLGCWVGEVDFRRAYGAGVVRLKLSCTMTLTESPCGGSLVERRKREMDR